MMKKINGIAAFLLAAALLFAGCTEASDPGETLDTEEALEEGEVVVGEEISTDGILSYFDTDERLNNMYEALSYVDFSLVPDYSDLRCEEGEDPDTKTPVNRYYDGDTLKFIDYGGGDFDSFETFAETGDQTLDVYYSLNEGAVSSVIINGEDFSVSTYEACEEGQEYGSTHLWVTFYQNREGKLDCSLDLLVTPEEGKVLVMSSVYQNEDGDYMQFSADCDENFENYMPSEWMLHEKRTSSGEDPEKLQKCFSADAEEVDLVLGYEKSFYVEEDEEDSWYFDTKLYLLYDEAEKAQKAADELGGELVDHSEETNGTPCYAAEVPVILPVSDQAMIYSQSLTDYLNGMLDESSYVSVTLDDDGKLISAEDGMLSFY